MRMGWTSEEVDEKLKQIMLDIHASCVQYGADGEGHIDYVKGANIAGFVKVADAMLAQGAV
jgi:glutamate dehydrogenase (NADP+)